MLFIPSRRLPARAGLAGILLACLSACAPDNGHFSVPSWRDEAAQIAALRLAEPKRTSGAGLHGTEQSAGSGLRLSVAAVEEPTVRLAADEPSSTTATGPAESPEEVRPHESQGERGPLGRFGDTVARDIRRAPQSLWDDTKSVYTNAGNLIILGLAGGAAIALRPEVDDDIEDHYDRHHSFKEDWRDAFGAMGNPGVHLAVAGVLYLAGQQMPSAKTYEVGRTLFNALIINDISTVLLKLAACTEAPNGEDWAFPSGHVSSTMTLAAVIHEAYGPLPALPLYGLTGLVAVERLDDREHHFSDVIFGAAMGWVIGHTVASGHRPEIFGGEVVPYADPSSGQAGVAWIRSIR